DLHAKNWYVHLWSPGKTYSAELGVNSADREFAPLACSNTIQTPRAWPIAEIENAERFTHDVAEAPQPPPTAAAPIDGEPAVSPCEPLAEGASPGPASDPSRDTFPSRDRERAVSPPVPGRVDPAATQPIS